MTTCLVTATDRDYFMATEVMLRSVDANYHGDAKLDVFVFVPRKMADWQFYKTEFKNINVSFVFPEISEEPEWDAVRQSVYGKPNQRITYASMYKFFIAECLQNYTKAIYLDPDTVIMRDIQPLLDYHISNPVGALNENHLELAGNSVFKDNAYFNSGVMIIDLKAWRILKVLKSIQKAMPLYENYSTGCHDQDILNYVFKNNWTPLPMSFNYMVNVYPNIQMQDPLVVHWAGNRKPWSNAANDKWRQAWKQYRMQSPTTM